MEKRAKTIARYLTGFVGLPLIVCGLTFADTLTMDISVALVSIITLYEYFNCFKSTGKANPSQWCGYLICIFISVMHIISKKAMYEILILAIPISLLILFIELVLSNGKKTIIDVGVTILGICYIPMTMIFLPLMRTNAPNGKVLVGYILCASWGSDMVAYLIGSHFGKHKFTKLSPNKTIEGCVAGVIGAVLCSVLYTFVINYFLHLTIGYAPVIAITMVLSIIGQIGDLAASSIKRYCGLKDFSELLPGHGGMLDRIDSMIFVIPFAFILLQML